MVENRIRLETLAKKALDKSSPEPERIASARALAKEILKPAYIASALGVLNASDEAMRIASGELLAAQILEIFKAESALSEEERKRQEAADLVKAKVAEAVERDHWKRRAVEASEASKTWVDYDPPQNPQDGFGDAAFGRKKRRVR